MSGLDEFLVTESESLSGSGCLKTIEDEDLVPASKESEGSPTQLLFCNRSKFLITYTLKYVVCYFVICIDDLCCT